MKILKLSKMAIIATTAVVLTVQSWGQQAPKTEGVPATAANKVTRVIVVSLLDRKLALVEDGQVKKVYPVAVGKPSTPSPVGSFTIEARVKDPVYSHDGKTVQPGPNNPVGSRWMGLSIRGYGIHGTNHQESIGKAASHGCIRMAKADVEEFFKLVAVGDTVELIGERNEETAQLFGTVDAPATVAQPLETAQAALIQIEAPAPVSGADNANDAAPAIFIVPAAGDLQ